MSLSRNPSLRQAVTLLYSTSMLAKLVNPRNTGNTPVGSGTVRSGNHNTPSLDMSLCGEQGLEPRYIDILIIYIYYIK